MAKFIRDNVNAGGSGSQDGRTLLLLFCAVESAEAGQIHLALWRIVCHVSSDMKTIVIREFTRGFAAHRHEVCQVQERGKVVGVWTPVGQGRPPKVDFTARLKKTFKRKLPFTGAQLLKESNPR